MVTYSLHKKGRDDMAKDIPSKKYKGVYYRELKNGDRSYFVIMRIDGKQKRISIGKKSEGITEAFCYQQKIKIINADKFGEEEAQILQKKKKSDPSFAELFDYYESHGPAKASTKKIMRYMVDGLPFRDKKRVTVDDVMNYTSDLAKSRAPGTINNKLNMLSSIFKFGIESGKYRFQNPCENVKRIRYEDKRRRFLSKDEIQNLLDALQDKPNLYLFVKISLCTAARLSTVIRIHANDIQGDAVRLHNVKTGRDYIGYLDKETVKLLRGKRGYIFGENGDMPDQYAYQWRILRVMNKLFNEGVTDRLDRVVLHTLRHTAASLMVQNGTPLYVVAKVLDHQSIKSTERYAKLKQENIRSELNRLWNN
jgi:integrase